MSFLEKNIEHSVLSDNVSVEKVIGCPRVSVVVPTYYDWDRLQKCIDALSKQSFPQDQFEVIIVNNALDDVVPANLLLSENVSLIKEGKPGSYAARNAALKIAQGDILAFTDSDCIPDPFWLESAVARLEQGAELVAGKIELFFKTDKLTIVEIYEKAFAFDQEKYVTVGGSATANMVTWSRHFETVGHFNDALMSGGDVEWGRRANEKGIVIEYASEVIVNHPARSDIKAMLKKKRRLLGGEINKNKQSSKNNFILTLIKGCLPPRKALKLFLQKDLTFKEKLLAYLLCYFLKVYSTVYRLALLLGLAKPKRS
ncbi:glycosyltransferase [Halomonas sp. 7T]|uniref:glycosyltransferase n=1 Tax=Halomonas sp. 7T TaxID=2893469 RepID=UPI0021DB7A88|nr:glycosyltransferase [Halomonas sp. 7T]UXZ55437.1 glycosyltransferase [Halomonas sp. 7T]